MGERVGGGAGGQREVRLSVTLGGSLKALLCYFVALACVLGAGALTLGFCGVPSTRLVHATCWWSLRGREDWAGRVD